MTFQITYVSYIGGDSVLRPPQQIQADSLERAKDVFLTIYPGISASDIIEIKPLIFNRKSVKDKQYLRECYEYLVEKQPLFQPFGVDGKKEQAKWRAEKGFSYIDPVQSNLSSWGRLLKQEGLIQKRNDGAYVTTDLQWLD